jgi:hypothetical protein
MRGFAIALPLLLSAALLNAGPNLDIYWIDTEGVGEPSSSRHRVNLY